MEKSKCVVSVAEASARWQSLLITRGHTWGEAILSAAREAQALARVPTSADIREHIQKRRLFYSGREGKAVLEISHPQWTSVGSLRRSCAFVVSVGEPEVILLQTPEDTAQVRNPMCAWHVALVIR
jgi:hypothetical protein